MMQTHFLHRFAGLALSKHKPCRKLAVNVAAFSVKLSSATDSPKRNKSSSAKKYRGPGRKVINRNDSVKKLLESEDETVDTSVLDHAQQQLQLPTVVVKRGRSVFIRRGHPMLFGNAVETVKGNPQPGDVVIVCNGANHAIAWGVFNPTSMYRVRVFQLASEISAAAALADALSLHNLVRHRVQRAVELRACLGLPSEHTNVYRLINSEGDGLSGLVVDVFSSSLVVSSSAFWLERHRDDITDILMQVTGATGLVWRQSEAMLKAEGWTDGQTDGQTESSGGVSEGVCIVGTVVDEVIENGVKYKVDLVKGQKTGAYADQRDNRQFLAPLCKGARVLDLCCYSGGFGLNAALHGAAQVTFVDSSQSALDLAEKNAEMNGVADRCTFHCQDIASFMASTAKSAHSTDITASNSVTHSNSTPDTLSPSTSPHVTASSPQHNTPHQVGTPQQMKDDISSNLYDVIILDPPKLAPNRSALPQALRKYRRLNIAAMRLLRPGGYLMTCSCSGAIAQTDGQFAEMLREAAVEAGRQLLVLREAGAAVDHPVKLAFPEGKYLTSFLLRVD